MRRCLVALLAIPAVAFSATPERFAPGDLVRLKQSEMLQFKGKDLTGAAKGQEFPVLKHDSVRRTLFVSFVNDDGELIAVTLPAEAAELVPPTAWMNLRAGAELFRDGRSAAAHARLAAAGKDPALAAIAAPLSIRIDTAIATATARSAGLGAAISDLRQSTAQLDKLGYPDLALAIDIGTDRLAQSAPNGSGSLLDRPKLAQTVAAANLRLLQARQAIGLHRGIAALDHLVDGLKLAPANPELKALKSQVEQQIVEAGARCDDADRMRRFTKGAVHALTAIEMGLKLCADHPRLLALRKQMEAQFTERTSPPVTAAFVKVAQAKTATSDLERGHKLYTTRCTECHLLELLDSRSLSSWRDTVASMSRRANLSAPEQT
ncbi:MAG: hypothetical protein ABI680_20685, partial [Chthoniobacteraceae bacterium]